MYLNLADSKLLILVAKSLVVKFSLEKVNRNPAAGNPAILTFNMNIEVTINQITILEILGPADQAERSSQIHHTTILDTTRAQCQWPPTACEAVSRPSTCAYVQASLVEFNR